MPPTTALSPRRRIGGRAMFRATLVCVAGVLASASAAPGQNPILPSWEYIPDGEPRVFGDRVYLYGSHDRAGAKRFCDYVLKVWSAPLSDLTRWRDEGTVLSTRDIGGHKDDIPWSDNEFYAPEIVFKGGKYYLYAQIVGSPCAVAVSDSPAGPFKVIGKVKAPPGSKPDFGGWSQYFDPGVLVDDDGRVYMYFGGGRSFMVELDPSNMTDVLPGSLREDLIPKDKPEQYQEGPSPRKIGDTYYLVYASISHLKYMTAKSPTGPFTFGGTIVRNGRDYPGGNNHGGLCKINGQWYVFYHRMTHGTIYSRKACVERITFDPDGRIPEVEMTSLGFRESLDPFDVTPAETACVLKGGNRITEIDEFTHAVVGNKSGSVIGYKYFDFGRGVVGQDMEFSAQIRGGSEGVTLEIWIDGDAGDKGTRIGTVDLGALGDTWRAVRGKVAPVTGRHAVYLRFAGGTAETPAPDLRAFRFVKAE